MEIYACINSHEIIKPKPSEKIYEVEFFHKGYWMKRIPAVSVGEAKEKLLSEYSNAIYKRSKGKAS